MERSSDEVKNRGTHTNSTWRLRVQCNNGFAVDTAHPQSISRIRISRSYGIIITMYINDHPPPHFHARYAEHKAKFALVDLRMSEGSVPPRVRALVVEWATLHLPELRQNWERAQAQQALAKIDPLA